MDAASIGMQTGHQDHDATRRSSHLPRIGPLDLRTPGFDAHAARRPGPQADSDRAPRAATFHDDVYLIGLLVFAAIATFLLYAPAGPGRRPDGILPSASAEDERRMDIQDGQIKNLQMRVEMLEVKLRALQELDGYRAAEDGQHAAPIRGSSRIGRPSAP